MPKWVFQQSKIPSFNSAWGKRFAKQLWDFKMYCADSRRTREQYVRECDEAFLCKRYIPDTGAMDLIEDGEFGESDIRDNAGVVSIRLSLALMDKTAPWVTVSSREDDTQEAVQANQDYQLYLHRKAKTRRNMQRFIKQDYVRGSSYLIYDWEDRYRYRRPLEAEATRKIKEFLQEQGLSAKDAHKFTARQEMLDYSGPIITPIDFFDVWVEPFCDIVQPFGKPATILQRFRRLSQLKSELDDLNKKVYSNLDDVEPWDLEELHANWDMAGGRAASERLMGAPTFTHKSNIKLVPIYIMYFPYVEFEGLEFWDTYFHIALSKKGNKPTLIRVEENPSDIGLHHMLMDHYEDWFVPTPYGLSPVQFMLSKYHQKNFLQLLNITAVAHSVLPPKLGLAGVFRDEEINFGAGAWIEVEDNPLGLDVVKTLDIASQGAMLGTQMLKFYGDELRSASGVDGLVQDSGSRNLTKPKTATEINRDTTSGSYFLDNAAENLSEGVLQDLVQGVFQLSQIRAKPSAENPDAIEYEKYLSDKAVTSMLAIKDLQAKRSITVTGTRGLMNAEQEKQNLNMFFQIIGQIPDPSMQAFKIIIATKIAAKLNIPLPAELTMTPEQAVATNPQVQLAAIQQVLQNPQMLQVVQQLVAQTMPPQGAQNGQMGHAGPSNPQAHPGAGGNASPGGAR